MATQRLFYFGVCVWGGVFVVWILIDISNKNLESDIGINAEKSEM